eukprot:c7755_g1_i1 orf=102-1475(+)
MLRSGCRFYLSHVVTKVLPHLCRTLSVSRGGAAQEELLHPRASSLLLSSSESSSECESSSEAEDREESGGGATEVHQIQVLRAYLRRRRARCVDRVREQGLVPAVLVDADKDRRPKDGSTDVFLSLDARPLAALLKFMGKRDFVSRVFDMDIYCSPNSSDVKESLQVLPRNLNYGPGKTNILNIQFVRATPGKSLKLGVPLEYLGADQCPGLNKGGTLKKLAKYVVYNCKATELPAKIVVDMTVLEVGDRVQVQDLEIDFNLLHSDRTMPVCEIVKDVSTLKAKAKRLKNELYFKKRALAEKESHTQAHSLSDDEVEVSDDEVPARSQMQRGPRKASPGKNFSAGLKQWSSAKSYSAEMDEEISSNHTRKQTPGVGRSGADVECKRRHEPKKHKMSMDSCSEGEGEALPRYARSQAAGKAKVGKRDSSGSNSGFPKKGKPSERRLHGTPFKVNKTGE